MHNRKRNSVLVVVAALFTAISSTAALAVPVFVENPLAGTGNFTLIDNGDFEVNGGNGTQPTGWSDFANFRGVWRASDEQSFLGNYSIKSAPNNFSGAGFTLFRNVVTIPGETYILSAYFYNVSLTNAQFRIDNFPAPDNPDLGFGIAFPTESWVLGYDSFVASSTSTTIRIVMDGTVTSDQIMYVDGIGVTLASEFRADGMPEPSALGMMALALLVGLGFIRNTGPGS